MLDRKSFFPFFSPLGMPAERSTLCLKKNDNDVLRYNFNAHQPILIIFGRYIAE